MIDISFSYLFSVEVLHEYYSGLACKDICIIPTPDTVNTMNGYKMLSKVDCNLLVVGIQSTSSVNPTPPPAQNYTPFILPSVGTHLTFYIYYNNTFFFNFTEIPFSSYTPGSIFYFTNRNSNENNATPNKLFLTSAISNVSPYGLGALYINTTDNTTYQSLVQGNTATAANLSNPLLWRKTDTNRFATSNDVVTFLPLVSTYSLPSILANIITLTVTLLGYDTVAKTYTDSVFNETLTFSAPVSEFQLDLSAFPPGKYNLQLTSGGNTVNQFIYLDDGLSNSNGLLGVIDIYFDANLPADYQLLDSNNLIKSPLYSICFLNRASYWNYNLLPTDPSPGGTISDSAGVFSFNSLQSTTPIPFIERPSYNFNLTLTGSVQPIANIPCASPENLSTAYNSTFYNSEIYLNY